MFDEDGFAKEVFHAGKIIPYPRHLDRLHYVVRPGSERPPKEHGPLPEWHVR
jgi:hypothetical protein